LRTAGYELSRIGFKFDIVYTEDEFTELLPQYDIAWVISSHTGSGNQ